MNGIDEYVFYLTDIWKMVTCDIMNCADAQEGHQSFDEDWWNINFCRLKKRGIR